MSIYHSFLQSIDVYVSELWSLIKRGEKKPITCKRKMFQNICRSHFNKETRETFRLRVEKKIDKNSTTSRTFYRLSGINGWIGLIPLG